LWVDYLVDYLAVKKADQWVVQRVAWLADEKAEKMVV
jgi:hypothetical protein